MKWTTSGIVFACFFETDAFVNHVYNISAAKKVVNEVLRYESSHLSVANEGLTHQSFIVSDNSKEGTSC